MIVAKLKQLFAASIWTHMSQYRISLPTKRSEPKLEPGQSYSLSYAEADTQMAAPKRDRRTRLLM